MKEKEAKKIAAKKRLEEKNKKKTEEENAMRKGEALQVYNSFNIFLNFKYLKISDYLYFNYFIIFTFNKKVILNFFRLLKTGKQKRWNTLRRKIKRRKNVKEQRNRKRRKLLLRKEKIT